MRTFIIAALATAACAWEDSNWGNPAGDSYSSYNAGYRAFGPIARASPAQPRLGGPSGYNRARPSSNYGRAQPRFEAPQGPRGYGIGGYGYGGFNTYGDYNGHGDAAQIIGDGYGDAYGHGRGFNYDDVQNLEVNINDRDNEFESEVNINDADSDNDLEIEFADFDIEGEIEDEYDQQIRDGALWSNYRGFARGNTGYGNGYGGARYGGPYGHEAGDYGYGAGPSFNRGYGTVAQVGLLRDTGLKEKRQDQSYDVSVQGYGKVDAYDTGLLNRVDKNYNYPWNGQSSAYQQKPEASYGSYGGYGFNRSQASVDNGYLNGWNNPKNYVQENGYDGIRSNIDATKYENKYGNDDSYKFRASGNFSQNGLNGPSGVPGPNGLNGPFNGYNNGPNGANYSRYYSTQSAAPVEHQVEEEEKPAYAPFRYAGYAKPQAPEKPSYGGWGGYEAPEKPSYGGYQQQYEAPEKPSYGGWGYEAPKESSYGGWGYEAPKESYEPTHRPW